MRLAFDTSVLVAALVETHPHHDRARPWIQAVSTGRVEAQMTWHAVAETWSVLTRLPGGLRLKPATASLLLERLLEQFEPIEISGEIYRVALQRCTDRDLRSGALFDALHMAPAESEGVDGMVTFNEGDFERLRSETSPRIFIPPDPPAFLA